VRNPATAINPPRRYSQYANMFRRGKATSGAPICKRHQRIREPRKQRSGEEQQHDGAVHREHLVELGRVVDDLQPGAASSARMTRAISPPTMKKKKVVAK
jgi:hypothetical protein